jgi:branched-chain amino acid transport system permease protein
VLPSNYLANPNSDRIFLWTALVLLLITVFCSWRMRDSRLGRAWIAIREDEIAAAAMGIPLMRTKTWAYAMGAFFGGAAGAYYAFYKGSTFPGDFFFNISVFLLCMVILGGMGNIWGVILGAAFLSYLDRSGLANTGAWLNDNFSASSFNVAVAVALVAICLYGIVFSTQRLTRVALAVLAVVGIVLFGVLRVIHLPIEVPLYASGIYGLIILLVMLFRPEGLIPDRRHAHELHEGVADDTLYGAELAGE